MECYARYVMLTGLAGKIVLVGFDSTDFLIEGLQKQDVDALIIQNPKQMGYLVSKLLPPRLIRS